MAPRRTAQFVPGTLFEKPSDYAKYRTQFYAQIIRKADTPTRGFVTTMSVKLRIRVHTGATLPATLGGQ